MTADADSASVRAYLDELAQQRRSSLHTVRSYRHDLELLCRLLAELPGEACLASVQSHHIRRFVAQLHTRGLGGRSLGRTLSAWRGFFGWLGQRGQTTHNPVDGVRPPKSPQALPKVLAHTPFFHDGVYSSFRGRRHGRPIEPTITPGWRYVGSLQTHDQIGNRATGERLSHLAGRGRAAIGAALLLTSPYTPMLFMGEEFDASTPWQYFTDHEEEWLAESIRAGRQAEFAEHGWSGNVPDPQDPGTVEASTLNWADLDDPGRREFLAWYKTLLRLRRELPTVRDAQLGDGAVVREGDLLLVRRGTIEVLANLGDKPGSLPVPDGSELLASFGEVVLTYAGEVELGQHSTGILRAPLPDITGEIPRIVV